MASRGCEEHVHSVVGAKAKAGIGAGAEPSQAKRRKRDTVAFEEEPSAPSRLAAAATAAADTRGWAVGAPAPVQKGGLVVVASTQKLREVKPGVCAAREIAAPPRPLTPSSLETTVSVPTGQHGRAGNERQATNRDCAEDVQRASAARWGVSRSPAPVTEN